MKIFKKISGTWIFLIGVILLFILTAIINLNKFLEAINNFYLILLKILPLLAIVFVLMFLINYFVTPKFVKKYLINSKKHMKWFYSIIFGIISTGPIYMWYPLLADLKEKGVTSGMIATFLYARAIKPALIPLMIVYFGWIYTLLFIIFIIIFSFIQGILIGKWELYNKFKEVKNENSHSIYK